MESQEAHVPKLGVVGRAREGIWKILEKDTLSQNVQKQWAEVSRVAASKMDAKQLQRFKLFLTDQAENIGKTVAIAENTVDIVAGVMMVGIGGKDLIVTTKDNIASQRLSREHSYHLDLLKDRYLSAGKKTVIGAVVLGVRPIERMAFYAGKLGLPIAERVATIVNTIALKNETSKAPKVVMVGVGRPTTH